MIYSQRGCWGARNQLRPRWFIDDGAMQDISRYLDVCERGWMQWTQIHWTRSLLNDGVCLACDDAFYKVLVTTADTLCEPGSGPDLDPRTLERFLHCRSITPPCSNS